MVNLALPINPIDPAFMPLWDLFRQLRQAGMKLTIEDYQLFRRSISSGFGLADWADLEDICRFLWVKPSQNYDADVFDREFARYRSLQQAWLERLQPSPPKLDSGKDPVSPLNNRPLTPPPRKGRSAKEQPQSPTTQPNKGLAADAVKDLPLPDQAKTDRFDIQIPIDAAAIQRNAKNLPRSLPDWRLAELDIKATVDQIGREGIFAEEVLRPLASKKANLLLLIDDSNAMCPFAPVVQPFVQMMMQQSKGTALIYRFNQYPSDYLHHWQRPLWGIPWQEVTKNLSKQRTVVIIVGDAGAASTSYEEDRVIGTGAFLERLVPAVRDVLWVNPLPPQRWPETTAEPIDSILAGRMIFLEPANWQRLTRTKQFRAEVQLRSLATFAAAGFDEDDW
jgi:uncharacterized protein